MAGCLEGQADSAARRHTPSIWPVSSNGTENRRKGFGASRRQIGHTVLVMGDPHGLVDPKSIAPGRRADETVKRKSRQESGDSMSLDDYEMQMNSRPSAEFGSRFYGA